MKAEIVRPLQLFSQEKLDEFREMSLEARLEWLEQANALIMLVHGVKNGGNSTKGSATCRNKKGAATAAPKESDV